MADRPPSGIDQGSQQQQQQQDEPISSTTPQTGGESQFTPARSLPVSQPLEQILDGSEGHHEPPAAATRETGSDQTAATAVSEGELRRGVGGFSALVDAFMNGFRQAIASQQQSQQQQQQQPQSQTQPSMPSAATLQAPLAQPADGVQQDTIPATASTATSESVSDTATESEGAQQTTQPPASSGNGDASSAGPTSDNPRTLFFRMPFATRNGQTAVLAFNPGPIPVPPTPETPRPGYGPDRPANLGPERGNGLASGFHLPNAPIFVPLGASPLPFSFLFDTQTNTAWPIATLSFGPPGSMPAENPTADTPQFVAGPPFHIALNISFGPPPEPPRPEPERAARFVGSLERADVELRSRMARLGMGDIGDYGGRQENEGGEGAALGCGICLDEYPEEDRPEWIGGQASIDEEVVAVPCAGHHTLHHRCLYEWLANTPPSQWTCPFCRAPLDKEKVDQSAQNSRSTQTQLPASGPTEHQVDDNDKLKKAEQEAKARSLREEVRLRERARGWRCDSPACLPRYPSEKQCKEDDSWPVDATSLITLLPCRHKMHVDCLCTSMKLEQAEVCSDSDPDDEEEEEEEVAEEAADEHTEGRDGVNECGALPNGADCSANGLAGSRDTVGKWVSCPLCRHEAWAELPARRRPKRVESTVANVGEVGKTDREAVAAITKVDKDGLLPNAETSITE